MIPAAVQVSRFSALADMTPEEMAALATLGGERRRVQAGVTIRAEGQAPPALYFLHEGWATSSVRLGDGERQIVKLHMPGDIMGAPSLPYAAAVDTLETLTASVVGVVPLAALGAVFARLPRLAAVFFLAAQEERVTLVDRLTAVGRLGAKRAVASLFVHICDRLAPADDDDQGSRPPEINLTQQQIADLLGLSVVHVNRVMRELLAEGAIRRRGRSGVVAEVELLRALAGLPRRRLARNLDWLPAAGGA